VIKALTWQFSPDQSHFHIHSGRLGAQGVLWSRWTKPALDGPGGTEAAHNPVLVKIEVARRREPVPKTVAQLRSVALEDATRAPANGRFGHRAMVWVFRVYASISGRKRRAVLLGS
jgi:hypothetical protein